MAQRSNLLPVVFVAAAGLLAGEGARSADIEAPRVTVSAHARADLDPESASNPHRVAASSRLATQVIDRDEIAALRPRDVFELLDRAVGVQTMSQGRKVPFTVRVRGDTQFAFIIDGVYVPQLSAGRMLQSLPVDVIEQVQVVRDATALGLGPMVNFLSPSGAPNDGFIAIRTRRPAGPELGARVSASTFETTAGSVRAGNAGPSGYAGIHASGTDTAGRPGEHMAQSATSLLANAGFRAGALAGDFMVFRDRTHQQIQAADPARSTLWPQRWSLAPIDTTLSSARLTAQWAQHQVSMLTLARSEVTATLLQGSVLVPEPNLLSNRETIDTIDARHTLRWGRTRLSGGMQWLHWNTPTGQMFFEGIPREEGIGGTFIQAERDFLNGRIAADVAWRRDAQHVVRGVDRYEAVPVPGTLQVVTDRRLPASNFLAAGAALRLDGGWTLTGRLYHARQGAVPGMQVDPGVVLNPEVQLKRELGLAYRSAAGWSATLTAFDARIENAKVPVRYVTARGVTTAVFGERDVDRGGFELQLDGHAQTRLGVTEWRLGWSHLTGVEALVDQGRGAPRDVVNGFVRHQREAWDVSLAFSRVGAYPSNFQAIDGRVRPIGDYLRADASVGYSWRMADARARLAVFGRNLGDSRYQTQLGFPDPGLVVGTELMLER